MQMRNPGVEKVGGVELSLSRKVKPLVVREPGRRSNKERLWLLELSSLRVGALIGPTTAATGG